MIGGPTVSGGGSTFTGGNISSPIKNHNGTNIAPTFAGVASGSGVYFPLTDEVAITTDATQRFRIDSSGNHFFNGGDGATAHGLHTFKGAGTTTGHNISAANSSNAETFYVQDNGAIKVTADSVPSTFGTGGAGIEGHSYGLHLGVSGGIALIVYTPTSAIHVNANSLVPWADGVPSLGKSDYRWHNFFLTKTITAAATTGAQTINKSTGSVNFAATDTSLVVTNSLVSTSSVIICTVGTNDTTMKSVQAVAAAGSFTMHANAAATDETRVDFVIFN